MIQVLDRFGGVFPLAFPGIEELERNRERNHEIDEDSAGPNAPTQLPQRRRRAHLRRLRLTGLHSLWRS